VSKQKYVRRTALEKFLYDQSLAGKDDDMTEVLDDLVHDAASNIASAVNNDGSHVEFLKEQGWSDATILKALKAKGRSAELGNYCKDTWVELNRRGQWLYRFKFLYR
jgi:hypothetical protein